MEPEDWFIVDELVVEPTGTETRHHLTQNFVGVEVDSSFNRVLRRETFTD